MAELIWLMCHLVRLNWNIPPSETITCVSWLHWYLHLVKIVCRFWLITFVTLVLGAIFCMENLGFIKVYLWVKLALIIASAYPATDLTVRHCLNPQSGDKWAILAARLQHQRAQSEFSSERIWGVSVTNGEKLCEGKRLLGADGKREPNQINCVGEWWTTCN